MKKNFFITLFVAGFILLMSSFAQEVSQWIRVSDTCSKCKFNDSENYCGNCKKDGLYRASSKPIGGGWVRHEMECKYCNHTCVWKEK